MVANYLTKIFNLTMRHSKYESGASSVLGRFRTLLKTFLMIFIAANPYFSIKLP
jgi:hypothetical protein